MSIEIFTSRWVDRLASGLAASLFPGPAASAGDGPDPFEPVRILVPSAVMKRWLQRRIARQNAVAAHLDMRFFEEGLWHCAASLEAHAARGAGTARSTEPLSREALQYLLVGCLLGADPKTPELAVLLRYVSGGGRVDPRDPAQARKLWHLANELARLFREYETHRPDLVRGWTSGAGLPGTGPAGGAQVRGGSQGQAGPGQAHLYRAVFSDHGLLRRLESEAGPRLLSLPRYCGEVLGAAKQADMSGWAGPTVHVFAVSQLCASHADLLAGLGPYFRWRIWHRESAPPAPPGRGGRPAGVLGGLAWRWGERDRDNRRLLHGLAAACGGRVEVLDRGAAPRAGGETDRARPDGGPGGGPGQGLLLAVQRLLGGGAPPDERDGSGAAGGASMTACRQDRSLQVAGCPGIHREVETVHNSILHNLAGDPSLKQTEIAVFVTDMELYKPVVESVFGREPRCLEYNLVDSSALEDSVYAQAVLGLLELAEGAFSRRAVFDLVLNPCFLAAAGIDRDEAVRWAEWAEQLNIFRGFDLRDKYAESGVPPDGGNGLYTWEQGLRRLRLGRIMEADVPAGGEREAAHVAGIVPWSAMEASDEAIGRFSLVIERLFHTVRRIRGGPRPGARWGRDLLEAADRFLAVPADRGEEAFVRGRFRRSLAFEDGASAASGLQLLDRIVSRAAAPGGRAGSGPPEGLTLPLVREFVRGALGEIESRRGRLLADGVTVTTLKADRAVPFRVVYVLGLGEGRFPGTSAPFALDLRREGPRQPGDVDRASLNRFAFLETLLSVERKLYLTWVNRDLQKDQAFFPCSLVNELVHGVERDLLGAGPQEPPDPAVEGRGAQAFRCAEIPLKGSSPALVAASPDPSLPAFTDLLDRSHSAMDCLVGYSELLAAGRLEASAGERAQIEAAIQAAVPPFEATAPARPESRVEIDVVTLRELARFLENPFDASLQRHLRVYEDTEEDVSLPEDEPFGTSFPFDFRLMTGVTACLIETGAGLGEEALRRKALEHLARQYETCRMLGDTPDGAFRVLDQARYVRHLEEILDPAAPGAEGLAPFLGSRSGGSLQRNVVIGETGSGARSDLQFPPLSLEAEVPGRAGEAARRLTVNLHGEVPFLFERGRDGVPEILVLAPTAGRKDALPTKHALPAFLFYQACLASSCLDGLFARQGARVSVLFRDGVFGWTYPPGSPERAAAYLRALVEEFLAPPAFDLLPLAIVKAVKVRAGDDPERSPLSDAPDEPVSQELRALYAREVQDRLEADQEGLYPSFRVSGPGALARPRVPADAYDKVRRRLRPVFDFVGRGPGAPAGEPAT